MAQVTSGQVGTNYFQDRNLVFSWWRNSYSIEGNYSVIGWKIAGGGTGNQWYNSSKFRVDIDGVNVFNSANTVRLSVGTVVAEGTKTIYHNNVGDKNFGVYIECAIYTSGVNCSASGNWDLPTIPRASKITSGSGVIGGITTINISRASTSFTHTINYAFGSLTGTVGTNIGNTIDWRIPTTFYAQIPNSPAGNGTLTCITYSGSTEIGRSNFGFNASCNESECSPNFDAVIVDSNPVTTSLTNDGSGKTVIVNYASIPEFQLTYSAKNGATIKDIICNEKSVGVVTNFNLKPQNFKLDFKITVIDTRNFSRTITFQFLDQGKPYYFDLKLYTPLTISAKTNRTNQTSDDMKTILNGNFYNGNFKTGTPNTLTLKWEIREKGETGGWSVWKTGVTVLTPKIVGNIVATYEISTPVLLVNPHQVDGKFNYKNMYEVKYSATDLLNTTVGINTITRGIPNFELYEHGIFMNGLLLFKI